ETADGCTAVHRRTVAQVSGDRQAGIFDRHNGGGNRKPGKTPHMPRAPSSNEILRLEIPHFSGDLAWELRRVEGRDVIDRGLPRDEILPERIFPDSVGGDDAEASDHHTTTMSQPRLLVSGRSTCRALADC